MSNRYIHWPTLEELGIADRVRALIDQFGQIGFFGIQEVAYRELTLEFFSTYQLDKTINRLDAPQAVQFRLGGIHHHLSITKFGVLCGFYSEEYTQTTEYLESSIDFPHDVNPQDF